MIYIYILYMKNVLQEIRFELLEFLKYSVYVDLQYDEMCVVVLW